MQLSVLLDCACGSGTVLNTGFDTFTTDAPLAGQDGWLTAGAGLSTGVIRTDQFVSPGKSVKVTRAASVSGDQRWAKPVSGYPTQRFVTVDWDMRVTPATVAGGFGPFFGVETYDADVAPYVLGSLGVDATTGEVLYQEQDSGEILAGPIVAFNTWHHFRIVMDFSTDRYNGYVNGSAVFLNMGFVDRVQNLNNFTDADIATFAAAGDPISQSLSASAYFDNFVVRDGLIGDYDIDGDVDSADYTRWRMTYASSVAPFGNLADGSKNGTVDAADYVMWRKRLGNSLFSGTGTGGGGEGGAVPEPATVLSLLASAPFLWRHRTRKPVINRNAC